MSFEIFIAQDIILDSNNDLLVEQGDFVVSSSDDRHVNLIIVSNKGHYRFNPTIGVNAFSFLNSVGQADALKRSIQEQLSIDGFQVEKIDITENGKININAKRIR